MITEFVDTKELTIVVVVVNSGGGGGDDRDVGGGSSGYNYNDGKAKCGSS